VPLGGWVGGCLDLVSLFSVLERSISAVLPTCRPGGLRPGEHPRCQVQVLECAFAV